MLTSCSVPHREHITWKYIEMSTLSCYRYCNNAACIKRASKINGKKSSWLCDKFLFGAHLSHLITWNVMSMFLIHINVILYCNEEAKVNWHLKIHIHQRSCEDEPRTHLCLIMTVATAKYLIATRSSNAAPSPIMRTSAKDVDRH